jgi:hypothetical protein
MLKQSMAVVGAAMLAAAMWFWVQKIAIPHQQAEAVELGTPRGNLSDLYPRWLGARELFWNRRDPYGSDITREIQAGYYGRPIDPARPHDPKDQQAFAYPVYVVLVLAPTIGLPFPVVQRGFFWFLIFLTAASIPLWLQALGWKISGASKLIWIILALGSFPAIQGLKLQQLTLLVAGLVALAMATAVRRSLLWAGAFLALATIKPQLLALVILWLLIWVVGNWRERQRLLWSFTAILALLVIVGEMLLPGWIHEFRQASVAYYHYTGGGLSILDVALTPFWGRVVAIIFAGALCRFLWKVRRADETTADFQYSLALVLATTLLVIPMFAPYNQLLLVPALMVIVRSVPALWKRSQVHRMLIAVTALSVFWPWLAACLLTVTRLVIPTSAILQAWSLPVYSTFAIPLTVLALLAASTGVLRTNSLAGEAVRDTLRQGAASE